MGLRCLIGHDFGELQTDRDRQERGDEVVVTIREYRECSRCGQTRVVSENKEVRSAATEEAQTEPVDAAPRDPVGDVDVEDDGVILEDESDPPEERQRGEWPAADREADDEDSDAEPTPWPEVEGEDEGYAAEPADGAPAEGVEFGGGLTPEASPSEETAAEPEDDEVLEAAGDQGGFRRASPSPAPTGQQRTAGADSEFYCPECEYTTPTAGSSLRTGDICPECRLGYLTERERSVDR